MTIKQILIGLAIYEVSVTLHNRKHYRRKIAVLKHQLETARTKSRLYHEELNMAYKMLTSEEKEQVQEQFAKNEEFYLIVRDKLA